MAITVKPVANSAAVNRTIDGITASFAWDVHDIPGGDQGMLWRATEVGQIPRLDDPHVEIPDVVVTQIVPSPIGPRAARVVVTWSERLDDGADDPRGGPAEVDAGVSSETVRQDINGNRMVVHYRGPVPLIVQGTNEFVEGGYTVSFKIVRAEVQRPYSRVMIPRNEDSFPWDLESELVGTINASRWSGRSPKTWLCTAIRRGGRVSGDRVKVMYYFSRAPMRAADPSRSTWEQRGEFTNAAGAAPTVAVEGNGVEYFDVYRSYDFGRTGLVLR